MTPQHTPEEPRRPVRKPDAGVAPEPDPPSPDGDIAGVRIDLLDARGFAPLVDQALDVYREAMRRPADQVLPRKAVTAQHLTYPGVRAAVARRGDELVGFGYGHLGRPGQWWHDVVASRLGSEGTGWLEDCFEVVELHVRPRHHGRGLGRRLLLRLLDGVDRRTVLLSAFDVESVARRLYRSVGFVDLRTGFLFPGNREIYAIMGAELPLGAVDAAGAPPAPATGA